MTPMRTLSTAVLALTGSALTTAAHAAWEAVPILDVVAVTEDNVRLLPTEIPGSSSADSTSVDARLRATATGERGSVFIEPRARSDHYGGTQNEDLNGLDRFLRARGRYDWERVAIGFFADYDRQDIKDAEFTEAVPDDPNVADPIDPDTGATIVDEDRQRIILRPSLDFKLSERTSLVLESQILDVSYTGPEVESRVDFQDTQVAAGIVRRVDARNEVAARLIASDYVADFNSNETKTFGVEGTFQRPLARDWTFNLGAGVRRSDYTFLNDRFETVDNADTSFTYLIGFRQRGERNTINVDLGRETAPNSGGFLTLRDQVRVYLSRAMSQRLRGEVGVRYYTTKTLDDVVEDDDRDYRRVDLLIEWAMTETMYLSGGYAFTSQKFADDFDDATSNTLFVGFSFRGRSRQ